MKTVAIVISFLALIGVASAQSLKAQVESSNKAVQKFLLAKDVDGFTKYMKGRVTPDFKYIEAGKTMGFDKMCEGMKMGLSMLKKVTKADSKTVALKEKGTIAVVTTDHVMEGIVPGDKGKTQKMSFIGTSQETYVKKGGKWMLSKMAWLKQSMK